MLSGTVTGLSRQHRDNLVHVGRRSQQVLGLAGVTGIVVGLVVAVFDLITADVLLHTVLRQPLWVQTLVPTAGLFLAALVLRAAGKGTSPVTSDEYIRVFHEPGGRMRHRLLPFRLGAAIATLGSAVPLGYEGPALYVGAGIGSAIQRRFRRWFSAEDGKVLLVAGAAAGVAAIFKAPVTGLVFALEVPYQDDLARHMLLPAAISAGASYVTFAAIAGTEPILPVAGQPPFNLQDLGGAACVGLAAGVLARVFIVLVHRAKHLAEHSHPLARAVLAGMVIAGVVLATSLVDEGSLGLGPGYDALTWALDPQNGLVPVIVLATLRVAGTIAAVAGGGTGGLFIPLVIQGALMGRVVGSIFQVENATLFPVCGMAAFLGAGYRVPLAAVVFVAEFTGRPGFVVPGLIAAVVAQLVMGDESVSPYQLAGRVGHLEHRLRLPLRSVMDHKPPTATADTTVDALFWQHLVRGRQHGVAIVEGNRYLGMVSVDEIAALERDAWTSTTAADVMRTDLPTAQPEWTLSDAIRAIDDAGADRLAVCKDGRLIGMITATDLVQIDELLERTNLRS